MLYVLCSERVAYIWRDEHICDYQVIERGLLGIIEFSITFRTSTGVESGWWPYSLKHTKNVIKRWSTKDHFAEFFCTFKYNENGRYIRFIAIQGQNKSIVITPESLNRGGWGNIAHKIAKFIQAPERPQEAEPCPTDQLTTSFKEACRSNRWTTETLRTAQIQI